MELNNWEQRFSEFWQLPFGKRDMRIFISQELEKAREEAFQEVVKNTTVESITQAERDRILGIIKEMKRTGDDVTNYHYFGWNQALSELKRRLEE